MPIRLGRKGLGPGRRPVVAAAAIGAVVTGAAGAARRGAPGGHRYQMRQRKFAIGDDFVIEDDQGRRAFKAFRTGTFGGGRDAIGAGPGEES